MNRTFNSEEQSRQILHQVLPALKKRLQEVTDELRKKETEVSRLEHELEAKSILEDENDTLTQQLIRLKSYFQEKIKDLETALEFEKSEKNHQPSDGSISQDILHRERLQKQALESSLIHLQDLLTKAQKERQQSELDLNQARSNGVQLERVVGFLREQLEEIQKNNLSLRSEKETLEKEVAQQHERIKKLEESTHEKQKIELALKEKEHKLFQCERDIGLIKQTLLRGLKEIKELEARYEEALKEKGIALQKFQQSHFHLEKLREQNGLLQEKSISSQAACQQVHQELEETRKELKVAEAKIAVCEEQMEHLQKNHGDSEKELKTLKAQIFEKEGELLHAQQHMAKKVKEIAQLEDKNEELRIFVNELQQVQNQSRVKLAELQTAADFQLNLQKKLEEQQQELSKAHEQQIAKWEEKYFGLYEKWQSAEARLKELEKLEDKQKQLQGILASIGTVLTPSVENLSSSSIPIPIKEAQSPSTPPFAMQIPATKATQSLFERPKTQKIRQSFLE